MSSRALSGSIDALRLRVETSAAIVDSALDCIITIDGSGTVRSFNPAAERTFGYRREQAVGRDLADLIIPDPLRERHREALARLAEGGEARILDKRLELEAMRADGERFPIELTVTRVREDPPLYAGFVRDISERKRSEGGHARGRGPLPRPGRANPDRDVRLRLRSLRARSSTSAPDRGHRGVPALGVDRGPDALAADDPPGGPRARGGRGRPLLRAKPSSSATNIGWSRPTGRVVWFRDEETLLLDDRRRAPLHAGGAHRHHAGEAGGAPAQAPARPRPGARRGADRRGGPPEAASGARRGHGLGGGCDLGARRGRAPPLSPPVARARGGCAGVRPPDPGAVARARHGPPRPRVGAQASGDRGR